VKIGGYVGIATAVVAWYASFASVTNSTFGRTVLPVLPLAPAAKVDRSSRRHVAVDREPVARS
jgi:hypothetical protein